MLPVKPEVRPGARTCGLVGDSNRLDRSSDVNLDPGWMLISSSS